MGSVEQFVTSCSESGLLASEEIRRLIAQAPASAQQDSQQLVEHLVELRKLTPFQADLFRQGQKPVLGNYLLLEKIGQGGMGVVYRARQRRLDRVVALKVLKPALTLDAAAVERFRHEAHSAGQLNHPHIVTIHDADEAEGVHFLVMEYVSGQDLAQAVRAHGPLSVEQALTYVLQAARGLAHAHAHGIVHRDVKPSNLILSEEGAVKVLDLGLSRSAAEASAAGALVGTPEYLAPEQTQDAASADQRADIYSLGCTLYFLLTGHPPYGGGTPLEKALSHRDMPIPSLWMARPEVPDGLEAVFRHMIAKVPAERYQTMAEAITALEACQAEPQPAPRRFRRAGLLAAACLPAAVVVAVVYSANAPTDTRPLPQSLAQASPTPAAVTKPPLTPTVDEQVAAVVAELKKRNPGFDGKVTHTLHGPGDLSLALSADNLTDLSPLRALPMLRRLYCSATAMGTSQLKDLSPLEDMDLVELTVPRTAVSDLKPLQDLRLIMLDCSGTLVADLSPVANMPLHTLNCSHTRVKDLRPLRNLRLGTLYCNDTRVADLTPLQGMPLAMLYCSGTAITNLEILKGLKLNTLRCANTAVADLSPLQGMPLSSLDCSRSRVQDLRPLQGMQLNSLMCDFDPERDGPILRQLTSLKVINYQEASSFWSKYPGK